MAQPPPTFKDGYRQGVYDATCHENFVGKYLRPGGTPVVDILRDIRKELLTKKVTKWVNVTKVEPSVSDPAGVRYGYGVLYDDKATALTNFLSGNYIGTFPIEIEEEY